jgi:uncharacterized damage-inducible protein DinB
MAMSHLEAMFEHHLWANLRLLAFCAQLSDAVLDAPAAVGTFGSVREKVIVPWITVEATILADRTWKGSDHLEGVARETGQTWLRRARDLPDGTILEGEVDGEPVRTLAAVILTQAIDHGREHRTHVKTCLTQQGIEPPGIDSWRWDEATTAGRGSRGPADRRDRGGHAVGLGGSQPDGRRSTASAPDSAVR